MIYKKTIQGAMLGRQESQNFTHTHRERIVA